MIPFRNPHEEFRQDRLTEEQYRHEIQRIGFWLVRVGGIAYALFFIVLSPVGILLYYEQFTLGVFFRSVLIWSIGGTIFAAFLHFMVYKIILEGDCEATIKRKRELDAKQKTKESP